MKKDIFKTIFVLVSLTFVVLGLCGTWGGLQYLFDRDTFVTHEQLERERVVKELRFEPLTQNEIELIERLKESVDLKGGDLNDYEEVPDAESKTTYP